MTDGIEGLGIHPFHGVDDMRMEELGALGGREITDRLAQMVADLANESSIEEVQTTSIDFDGMSSSQILAFMARVMKDVDGQLAARASVLRERNAESAALSKEIAMLERVKLLADDTGHGDDIAIGGREGDQVDGVSVESWLTANGFPGLLDDMKVARGDRTSDGFVVTVAALEDRIEALKAQQNEINTTSEMDMIGFQATVQTRQLFVNLATQMMNSEHDGQNRIAQNIG